MKKQNVSVCIAHELYKLSLLSWYKLLKINYVIMSWAVALYGINLTKVPQD